MLFAGNKFFFISTLKNQSIICMKCMGEMFVSRETPADNWATVLTHPLCREMGTLSI